MSCNHHLLAAVSLLGIAACSNSASHQLPPLQSVPLTTERTLVAAHALGPDLGNPALPANLQHYLDGGYGELVIGPGDPYSSHSTEGISSPLLGPTARMLMRFAAVGDLQIGDDESPTRVGFLDSKSAASAALRPQDPYMCVLANATVRTVNAVNRMLPIDLVLVGGDVLDSAQENEANWALGILSGGADVECDSGADDDLVPGPDNDPKDPFWPEGLSVPWRWVPGNHDMLIQGNLVVDEGRIADALGDVAPLGTRDYQQGGAIVQRSVVSDPQRSPLSPVQMMMKMASHGDGHGLSLTQAATGHASYFFDVAGTPLRFLIVDTVSKTGGSGGVLRRQDLEAYLRPAMESAQREGKWVIAFSDHPFDDMGQANAPLGMPVADPVSQSEWVEFLGHYPNLLFAVARRAVHGQRLMQPPGKHPYWAVFNGSQSEYPHQFRLFEVWDADNGYVMLRITGVDVSVEGDPVAAQGRQQAVIDYTSTWAGTLPASADQRNVELWIRKP